VEWGEKGRPLEEDEGEKKDGPSTSIRPGRSPKGKSYEGTEKEKGRSKR